MKHLGWLRGTWCFNLIIVSLLLASCGRSASITSGISSDSAFQITGKPGPVVTRNIYEPSFGVYHGAWLPFNISSTIDPATITDFQTMVGKNLAMAIMYLGWYVGAYDDAARQFAVFEKYGIAPHVVWEPSFTSSTGVLFDITSGSQDAVIKDMAKKCAAYGKPIFLRFAHEMNGNWYPWSGAMNGGGKKASDQYKKAWQYVYTIFAQNGATNVIWVWAPNADSVPNTAENKLSNYYPGDQYVDWVGIDFYGLDGWVQDPITQINKVYSLYARAKPIMIAETACADPSHYPAGTTMTKPQWMNALFDAIVYNFPRVKAINWFNEVKTADWRVNSLPTDSLSVYKNRISNPYFLSKVQ